MIFKQTVTNSETSILLMITVKHITGLDPTQENPTRSCLGGIMGIKSLE